MSAADATARRVAVLADIHGNAPALEAALVAVREADVDLVVMAGDALPGPMPSECVRLLSGCGLSVLALYGNGDRETLAAVDGRELTSVPPLYQPAIHWNAAQLSGDDVRWLREWPATLTVPVDGIGRVLCCHATPQNDLDIFTRLTPEERIAPAFSGLDAAIVVCGHTHMAFDRTIAGVRVLNAGSVGMPFGEPGAHWLLLDAAGPRFIRTAYDLDAAAARIRASGYPDAAAFAAQHVLQPPTEAVMLEIFEPQKGR